MDKCRSNCCTKQAIPSCEPHTIHGGVCKCVSLRMKAMRGRITLRTPKAFARPHFPHTAGRQCETVERVVLNALANQLRLCRRVSCPLARSRNRLQEKPIHLLAALSSAYLWSFSSCFLTAPFSWRTSLSWLWRSGSWDFCGFGWWPLCLPCRYSGPGCFASPIFNSRAFSSC